MDFILSVSSYVEDTSVGVTDGGLLEGDKGVELKRGTILCLMSYNVLTIINLNLSFPHATKSENMKATKSFMITLLLVHGFLFTYNLID